MPVAVDPLVPPARLGALMVERRTERGLDVAQLAHRSDGMFTATYLEDAERGRVRLDDEIIGHLVGLYELHAGPVVPTRSELILDLDRQQLSVGDQSIPFDSLHTEDVLARYVALIYVLRGQEHGSDLTLRDRDLDVLAESLGSTQEDVRTEIYELIEAPASVTQAKQVSRARMVLGAGLLVGVTAVGTLVLVGSGSTPESAQALGEQPVGTSVFAAELGAAAEASVDYDFRSQLVGWDIRFADDHPDFLGITLSDDRTITVHVGPNATTESVAAVLMHEVGHALDLERMTDEQRAQWIELREMPATWWPGNGLSDFAVGAGDFAEAVSAVTTGSASSSAYGDFTAEQLAFVADIIAENG